MFILGADNLNLYIKNTNTNNKRILIFTLLHGYLECNKYCILYVRSRWVMPNAEEKMLLSSIHFCMWFVYICLVSLYITQLNVFFLGRCPILCSRKFVCLMLMSNVLSFSIFLILFHFSILPLPLKYTLN